ncbi:MAG: hypothetical protein FWF94_03110 [Oscillospiraceae bacterium]|nr:hypothetical protein [Oscillospiraceae bacterium]
MKRRADSYKYAELDGQPTPRKSRTTTVTVGVVAFLLLVFFTLMIGSLVFNRIYHPLMTETAFYYENTESILFNGVFIRNESQVVSEEFANYRNNGVIAYTNKCGAKLSPDSIIAVVYSSDDDIYCKQKINDLNEQIAILSEAKQFADTSNSSVGGASQDNSQLEAFSGQLSDTHLNILRNIATGNYERAYTYKNEYLSVQSKIIVSKGIGFEQIESRITGLNAEVESLENKLSGDGGVLRELTASESGYFVNNADGYESTLRFDDALAVSRDSIDNIIANPLLEIGNNIAGKVIDDYKWRMAAVLETEKSRAVSEGAVVNLRIGVHPQDVPVLIVGAEDQGDGYTVFIFEGEILNEEFSKKRVVSARLLLNDYSGIRLPRNAMTFDRDGESGVYVKNGSILCFKKIDMLRSEEGFVIIKHINNPEYLQLYDDVVISGRNLYDGKIVS